MVTTNPRPDVLLLALAYVVIVGLALLVWNAAGGGLIEAWYAEYVGPDGLVSGSGAWRGAEGSAFQMFALLLGTWVYPLSLVAVLGYGRRAWQTGSRARLANVSRAFVALAILAMFLQLGVFRAVASS